MNALESPINKSLMVGGLTFLMSAVILNFTKPDFVMTVDDDTDEEIVDTFKLYIFCIMISVTLGIVVFLCCYKKIDIIEYGNLNEGRRLSKRQSKSY